MPRSVQFIIAAALILVGVWPSWGGAAPSEAERSARRAIDVIPVGLSAPALRRALELQIDSRPTPHALRQTAAALWRTVRQIGAPGRSQLQSVVDSHVTVLADEIAFAMGLHQPVVCGPEITAAVLSSVQKGALNGLGDPTSVSPDLYLPDRDSLQQVFLAAKRAISEMQPLRQDLVLHHRSLHIKDRRRFEQRFIQDMVDRIYTGQINQLCASQTEIILRELFEDSTPGRESPQGVPAATVNTREVPTSRLGWARLAQERTLSWFLSMLCLARENQSAERCAEYSTVVTCPQAPETALRFTTRVFSTERYFVVLVDKVEMDAEQDLPERRMRGHGFAYDWSTDQLWIHDFELGDSSLVDHRNAGRVYYGSDHNYGDFWHLCKAFVDTPSRGLGFEALGNFVEQPSETDGLKRLVRIPHLRFDTRITVASPVLAMQHPGVPVSWSIFPTGANLEFPETSEAGAPCLVLDAPGRVMATTVLLAEHEVSEELVKTIEPSRRSICLLLSSRFEHYRIRHCQLRYLEILSRHDDDMNDIALSTLLAGLPRLADISSEHDRIEIADLRFGLLRRLGLPAASDSQLHAFPFGGWSVHPQAECIKWHIAAYGDRDRVTRDACYLEFRERRRIEAAVSGIVNRQRISGERGSDDNGCLQILLEITDASSLSADGKRLFRSLISELWLLRPELNRSDVRKDEQVADFLRAELERVSRIDDNYVMCDQLVTIRWQLFSALRIQLFPLEGESLALKGRQLDMIESVMKSFWVIFEEQLKSSGVVDFNELSNSGEMQSFMLAANSPFVPFAYLPCDESRFARVVEAVSKRSSRLQRQYVARFKYRERRYLEEVMAAEGQPAVSVDWFGVSCKQRFGSELQLQAAELFGHLAHGYSTHARRFDLNDRKLFPCGEMIGYQVALTTSEGYDISLFSHMVQMK